MIELQITLQILGIVALLVLITLLGYLLYMLGKINTKLDSILGMITYYEKTKAVVVDFMAGPGQMYINTAKTIFSFIAPLLTRSRKSK